MNSLSSSTALLTLCLLAVGAPALAAPPVEAPRPPDPYRCQPQPPESGVHMGLFEVSTVEGGVPRSVFTLPGQGSWVIGDGGFLAHRPHGAKRFEVAESPSKADLVASSVSSDGQRAWVLAADGSVHRWAVGAWSEVRVPGRVRVTAVDLQTEGLTVVADADGGWRGSKDEGGSWQKLDAPSGAAATAVHGGGVPLMGRADGSVVTTQLIDGTLKAVSSTMVSEGKPIVALHALRQGVFAAVDADGAVFSTVDRGQTWTALKSELGPVVALVSSPLGPLAVGRDGGLAMLGYDGASVVLTEGYNSGGFAFTGPGNTPFPAPPRGVSLGVASAGRLGVDAISSTGEVLTVTMQVWHTPGRPCGRPLEVGGEARLAALSQGAGWALEVPSAHGLSEEAKGALAAAWLVDARAEHASVASFARFVLRLMALGAPVELVREAQEAMADELRHAEQCYGLASRYAGELLAPGPLPLDGALDAPGDLASVAVEVLREGAIGETLGAALADAMQRGATDPEVKAVLAGIAVDEASHAQSGWRFLRWAVSTGGDPVREALQAALPAALAEHEAAVTKVVSPHVAGWQAHGRLSADDEREVVRRTLAEVVRPCFSALVS